MDDFDDGINELSADDVENLSFDELYEYLAVNDLDTSGTKGELEQRFKLFLENVPIQQPPIVKGSKRKADPIESTGQDALLSAASQIHMQKLSRRSAWLGYRYEMNLLKNVVEKIKNQNSVPSAEDFTLLEEIANDVTIRMPIFMPKYPGFHEYAQKDLVSQEYIQYLPEIFDQEKYVAIWTNPNGRKCPLC